MNKQIMIAAGFGEHVKRVEHGFCPMCSKPVSLEGADDLTIREYRISGMCPKCQDEVFNPPCKYGDPFHDHGDGCPSCDF